MQEELTHLQIMHDQTFGGCADGTASATLFVGGLTDKLTEEDLRGMFSLYGDLISVKCLASKGCAFVQYTSTAAAKAAMTMLQDQVPHLPCVILPLSSLRCMLSIDISVPLNALMCSNMLRRLLISSLSYINVTLCSSNPCALLLFTAHKPAVLTSSVAYLLKCLIPVLQVVAGSPIRISWCAPDFSTLSLSCIRKVKVAHQTR